MLSSLLLWTGPAILAQPSDFSALLEARAEAPAEPRSAESETARGAEPERRLFFMTGADNAACVRSVADVTADV